MKFVFSQSKDVISKTSNCALNVSKLEDAEVIFLQSKDVASHN